jgi:hypothetical protein
MYLSNVDRIVNEEDKLKMQSLKNSSMAERLVLFISLLQLIFGVFVMVDSKRFDLFPILFLCSKHIVIPELGTGLREK